MGLTARFVGSPLSVSQFECLAVWMFGCSVAWLPGCLSGQAQICLCKLNETTVKMPNKLICG